MELWSKSDARVFDVVDYRVLNRFDPELVTDSWGVPLGPAEGSLISLSSDWLIFEVSLVLLVRGELDVVVLSKVDVIEEVILV
jgi:hypothetical protein